MAWNDILNQELIKRVFQSHLASGRVPNAYLLAGPEGVGKRRLALEMAKALNCSAAGERPCDTCRMCGQIIRGTHPDVHQVSPGGASDQVKIDQIRYVIGRIGLRPFSGAYQVVILEAAERLTEEAANSLLKALEEPSVRTKFFLTTSQPADCLPTIVSRCQLLRAHPLSAETVQRILVSAHEVAPQTAQIIARLSGGSASRALALSQQWDTYQQRLARFAEVSAGAWIVAAAASETRQDVAELLDGMMSWLRDVAIAATGGEAWVRHRAYEETIARQACQVDLDRCLRTANELVELRESIDQFANPRLIASLAREKWLSLLSESASST